MTEKEKKNLDKINIITLGNSIVGKTSFIVRFAENVFRPDYLATIGIDFRAKTVELPNKKVYKVYFYDTAGQEKYKSISLNSIKNTNGVLLMYDVTNRKSFESISGWMQSILSEKGKDFPLILIGNKIDLENERVVKKEEGEKLAKDYEVSFMETSNQTGQNIQESVIALVSKIHEIKKKETKEETEIYNSSYKLQTKKHKNEKKKNKCC